MKWIRFRQKSSASLGRWEFMRVPDYCRTAKDVEEYMDSRNMLNNWSEHYRGIDVVFVKKVPSKELESRISEAESQLKFWREELARLKEMTPCKIDIREVERRQYKRKLNAIYKKKGLTHLIEP